MAQLRGDDKRRYVAEMFARISPRYDLMNSLMTGGLHHRWKRDTARLASAGLVGPALDVATGTGDLAFALARCPGVSAAVGVDLLPEMLRLAVAKMPAGGGGRRGASGGVAGRRVSGGVAGRRVSGGSPVHFVVGDALRLPFGDGAFVCATAGFSLRNMPDVPAAIAEMARVVAPGGRVATLELTPMPPGIRARLGRIYFHKVVPLLGEIVAGERAAYTYLPDSVDYFLTADGLAQVYRDAGLVNVGYRRLGMGGVAIHYGEKPPAPARRRAGDRAGQRFLIRACGQIAPSFLRKPESRCFSGGTALLRQAIPARTPAEMAKMRLLDTCPK